MQNHTLITESRSDKHYVEMAQIEGHERVMPNAVIKTKSKDVSFDSLFFSCRVIM